MNTAGADIRFLKTVLGVLIFGTLISGGVCAKLASTEANKAPVEIAVAAR